ncbi:hypothetical protein GCM10020221_26490 [Streptomyces thioluteus]|uniref:Uncharacterized protein n=1 Tax=Streptomyces thioluteus TaxID=66431 RepID=A0ABP6JFL5_STRTU
MRRAARADAAQQHLRLADLGALDKTRSAARQLVGHAHVGEGLVS